MYAACKDFELNEERSDRENSSRKAKTKGKHKKNKESTNPGHPKHPLPPNNQSHGWDNFPEPDLQPNRNSYVSIHTSSRTQSDHSADPLTYIAILADPGVACLFCKISLSVRRVDQTCVQLDSLVQSLRLLCVLLRFSTSIVYWLFFTIFIILWAFQEATSYGVPY